MLVSARVEVAPVEGEAHQEAQLFQSQVGAGKVAAPVARAVLTAIPKSSAASCRVVPDATASITRLRKSAE